MLRRFPKNFLSISLKTRTSGHTLILSPLPKPIARTISLKSIKNMAADANDGEIIESDDGSSSGRENAADDSQNEPFSLDENEYTPVDAMRSDPPKDGPLIRTAFVDEFECDYVDWQKKNNTVEAALRDQVRAKLLSFTQLMDALRNPLTSPRDISRQAYAMTEPAYIPHPPRNRAVPHFGRASKALRLQAALRTKAAEANAFYPSRPELPLVSAAPGELNVELDGEILAQTEKWMREKVIPRLVTGYGVYDEQYIGLKELKGLSDAVALRSYFFGDFRPPRVDKGRYNDADEYVEGLFDAGAAQRCAYNYTEARGGKKKGAGEALGEVYRKDGRMVAESVAKVKEDPFLVNATVEADPMRLCGELPRDVVIELEPGVRAVRPKEMPRTSFQATFVAMMRAGCHYGFWPILSFGHFYFVKLYKFI